MVDGPLLGTYRPTHPRRDARRKVPRWEEPMVQRIVRETAVQNHTARTGYTSRHRASPESRSERTTNY
jgi:hypothetical protein